MVVAVIAVTAGLAAPTMYNAFAERRTASAPIDFVRMVRRARSEAMAYGRAHLIRFDATSPGRFLLFRGVSSSCVGNTWEGEIIPGTISGQCGVGDMRLCIEELNMASDYYSTGALDVRVTDSAAAASVDICYEPTGRTLFRAPTTAALSDDNTINGGRRFNFRRYEGGSPLGVTRQVVVPLGGEARVLR